jgi:class 3 adenylate cyclase
VPTLVIQRLGDRINPPFYGRYLASHIAGARYFEQPGDQVLRVAEPEDLEVMFAEIEDFLAVSPPLPAKTRVLSTILLAEITGDLAADAGAANQREAGKLAYPGAVKQHVLSHRGHIRNSTGSRVLATFDAPGQAIRCAIAIRDDSAARGIGLRAGIHTGEVDIAGDEINGISVHIADRITTLAQPGQILTSRTVKDLLVGSGIAFAEVGAYELAETGNRWPVYVATGA